MIFESSSTMTTSKRPPLHAEVLAQRQVDPPRPAKSCAASLSLNAPRRRSENSHTGSCGGVRFISMKSGAIACAHRRLGGDEQAREVHRAPREVLGLHAVARRRRARRARRSASSWNSASMTVMMAIAPSTMMSATPRSLARAALARVARAAASERGAHWRGSRSERGCWIGMKTLVMYAYGGPPPTPLSTSVISTSSGRRFGCPVTCVESHVSTHWPVSGSRYRTSNSLDVLGDDVDDAALQRLEVDRRLLAPHEIHLVGDVGIARRRSSRPPPGPTRARRARCGGARRR